MKNSRNSSKNSQHNKINSIKIFNNPMKPLKCFVTNIYTVFLRLEIFFCSINKFIELCRNGSEEDIFMTMTFMIVF